jgi:CubicO group peptidase (beta-lactamase class C family)
VLAPVRRGITIHDLLTHRAGFIGVPPSINPPAEALRRKAAQTLPANFDFTLEQYVKNLAASPLDSQRGTTLRYGPATEVLGRLVEVVSGRTLPEFFAKRVFQPLGMVDTSFTVPVDKRSRVATAYRRSADGTLVALPPYSMAPKFFSAAGNVFSTPMDYLRLCQMLLGGWPGPAQPGAYGWAGGYNTYFRIDPKEDLILMLFVQQALIPGDQELQFGFHNTVMQAIAD